MDRTKLNRHFHALLRELGITEYKEDILSGYGVESTKDLTDEQLRHEVETLENEKRNRIEAALRTHRSKVLRLLTDVGVYYVVSGEIKNECWQRVNKFLESPKIAGKVLYRMNVEELTALEQKLRAMKDKGYIYKKENASQELTHKTVMLYMNLNGTVN